MGIPYQDKFPRNDYGLFMSFCLGASLMVAGIGDELEDGAMFVVGIGLTVYILFLSFIIWFVETDQQP